MAKKDKIIYDGGETTIRGADITAQAANETCPDSGETVLSAETIVADGDVIIEKGASLLDTYRVETDAIQGGMGKVWRVYHTGWNVELAMKRPKAELFQSELQKKDFIHECEEWVHLGLHPHIVSCYYVREIGGVPSIFAEWMQGGSLKNRIYSGKLYEGDSQAVLERVLDIAIQFGRGLHYAHEQGLIHQDVKPDNLLLTSEGEAKVADFGIAKTLAVHDVMYSDTPSDATMMSGSGAYTPAYCSMEQMNGEMLTRRTDIYSWAVSVLEMFLGERHWQRGTTAGLSCEDYFAMDMQVPMPNGVKDLLRECLNESPVKRPHDFAEIDAALLRVYKETQGVDYQRIAALSTPDLADNWNNRALSFLDLNMPEQAEKCWAEALKVNPNHSDSRYNRAVHFWNRGVIDSDEAMTEVRMDYENHFGDPHTSLLAAKISMQRGDSTNAKGFLGRSEGVPQAKELMKLLPVSPGDYRCDYMLSKIVDYNTSMVMEQKYMRCEEQIRVLASRKDIEGALRMLNASVYNPELQGFAFSPRRLTLNEELGRYGFAVYIASSWKIRNLENCFGRTDAFTFDSRRYFCDGALYDTETGEKIVNFPGSVGAVYSGFSFDNRFFLQSEKAMFRKLDAKAGSPVLEFTGHTGNITSLMISSCGRYAVSAADDGCVMIWNMNDGKMIQAYSTFDGKIKKVAINHDISRVAALSANVLAIWDTTQNKPLLNMKTTANDFCVNNRFNKIFLACLNDGLWSYDVEKKFFKRVVDKTQPDTGRQNPQAISVCLSPNEQLVATSRGNAVLFWNVADDHIINILPTAKRADCVSLSPNGKYAVISRGDGKELWRLDYNYIFHDWKDWDDGVLPYLNTFAARHPENYSREDFELLLMELQNRGYGYVRPESIRAKLDVWMFGW